MIRLTEDKIKGIIRNVLSEALNATGRDPNASQDGRYYYQGTGSKESDERTKKVADKRRSYSPHVDYERHGGKESNLERRRKEMDGFEDVPYTNDRSHWDQLILYLRNLASRNGYDEENSREMVEYLAGKLNTREGAKSFIEYLYKNGFRKK